MLSLNFVSVLVILLKHASAEEYEYEHKIVGDIPVYIKPLQYKIELQVDQENDYYTGVTNVLIKITKPCVEIPIHYNGQTIAEVKLRRVRGPYFTGFKSQHQENVDISEVKEDGRLLRIIPTAVLTPKLYNLRVTFKQTLQTYPNYGLYKYTENRKRYGSVYHVAVTYFSPDRARKAYPCFDEPRLKARFRFVVKHRSWYTALSNTEVKSTKELGGGWTKSTFKKSHRMSTYLTIVAISNFSYIEDRTSRGVVTRVYDTADPEGYYGGDRYDILSYTTSLLDNLEEYFGIPYPYPKLYVMVAYEFIPHAMEQYGLITFQNSYGTSRVRAELYLPIILAHEVAHMWFGNMVSNEWWDSIHIKEGVVSWLCYGVGGQVAHNGINYTDELFISLELSYIMDTEFHDSTYQRPMLSPVKTDDTIVDFFDLTTYRKGASLSRMVNAVLGDKTYQIALRRFLRRHKRNGTATTMDLVEAYHAAGKQKRFNVREFIKRYLLQAHYPLVTVKMINGTHVNVTQELFVSRDTDPRDSPFNYTWHIPFTYVTDTHRNDKVEMLTQKENIVKLKHPSKWIKANNNFKMLYRNNYDMENWNHLKDQMLNDHFYFTAADRAHLISDMFALKTNGMIEESFVMEFMTYAVRETEVGPWLEIEKIARELEGQVKNDLVFTAFEMGVQGSRPNATFKDRLLGDINLPRPTSLIEELGKSTHNPLDENYFYLTPTPDERS